MLELETRPYPNEHSARLNDPQKYKKIRRENNKFGDGIHVIWGIKDDGTVEIQAIRFDKKKFTPEAAKKWLKDHGYGDAQFEAAAQEKADGEQLSIRSMTARPDTLREEDRSVIFTVATEAPCPIMDWQRGQLVDEVLVMKGIILPENNQVPLLDSHSRASISDVIGSVREFGIDENGMYARAYFSRNKKGIEAFNDVRDGHITDVSVGYSIIESQWIPEGEKRIWEGREFIGPLKLTTKAALKEVSLTPIGADPSAKVRSIEVQIEKKEFEEMPKEKENVPKPPETEIRTESLADPAEIERKAIEKEQARVSEIMEICRSLNLDSTDYVKRGLTVDQVRAEIIHTLAQNTATINNISVQAGESDGEKFTRGMTEALFARANPDTRAEDRQNEFRGMSLLRMAEECLIRSGISTKGMTPFEIADKALRGAYNIVGTTADFPNILYNTANKSVMKGFQEFPRTWNLWCSVGDVPDFKENRRVALSEAPDLEEVNEAGEYPEAKFKERGEAYTISTFARRWTITRKAIINDDKACFGKVPRAFGQAAARKIESLAYGILNANEDMADGIPLFHASHRNLADTPATLSSTSLSLAMSEMMKQKGFGDNNAPIVAIPRLLLVPAELKVQADILCNSMALYEKDASSAVYNPFNNLIPVASPFLSAGSATAWYLVIDPNAGDTVELGFLNGVQTPYLQEFDQIDKDGRIYVVRIDVGAKALAFEGLYKNAGA